MSSSTWDKLNRLAKWRMVLAGWQLGTRADTDPEARAVRDQREVLLMLRAENNALLAALIDKGLLSMQEWLQYLGREAEMLNKDMERRFPGMHATDAGMVITAEAVEWMTGQGWKP